MVAAAARLAALPIDGDSPTAIEIRWVRELLQTALAQQEAYSYSQDRIHSTPRPGRSPSYSRHMVSATGSSNVRRHDPPPGHGPVHNGAFHAADQDRARQETEQVPQLTAYQTPPAYPTTSLDVGIPTRTGGVPCLVPALRNERLPKDFKGPRKVPNYTADLQPAAWIESYEMAMELLEVSEAAMAKYFTMMLDGTARTWLKGLPPNSIGSWAELKARFIQNFKDTCRQSMSIVDLTNCKQQEGESTTHWVRRVKEIIHS